MIDEMADAVQSIADKIASWPEAMSWQEEIEAMLKVESGMDLICLVAVGYPDESPQKGRKPVDQVLKFID